MNRAHLLALLLSLGLSLAQASLAQAQVESARRLSAPSTQRAGPVPSEGAGLSAEPQAEPARTRPRSHRQRRLRLSIALAGAISAGVSFAVADVAARRRGGPCALTQPDPSCDRARRATGLGAFAATSMLVTPLALWAVGKIQGGRGGYTMPWLMTVAGLMVGGLVVAMTQGLAHRQWGRRVGYAVGLLMPATFGALGYLARDAERRRFGGSVSFAPLRGGGALAYSRRF